MNWAHVHIILNHIPPLGSIFGFVLLICGIVGRSNDIKRAALWTFIVVAVLTIPVYLTGEPAEEMVEHMPGVSEEIIGRHEDSALYSLAIMELLGLISLIGMLAGGINSRKWFVSVSLVLSVVAVALTSWTAYLGGQINHPEARYGLAVPPVSVTHAEKE